MKNNKGFTIVELLASFTLSMIIVIIMFQIIINLKDLYQTSTIKSDLMNKQNIITNKIYTDLTEKTVTAINECGESCVGFMFGDGSASELRVDYIDENKRTGYLTYGDYTIKVDGSSYFDGGIIYTYGSGIDTGYNRLLEVNIPIYNKLIGDTNVGINIVYPYNQYNVSNLSIDTENGYVSDGLIVRLDAINNTGEGHSNSTDTWSDLSGNGNDATLYNSPTIGNNSIIFDGVSNYGLINNTANMEFPNGITIEIRLNDINNSSGDIFSNFVSNGVSIVNSNTPKKIDLFMGIVADENVYSGEITASNSFDSSATITYTYDNNTIKYFYNGYLMDSVQQSGFLYISLAPFALGANPSPSIPSVDAYGQANYQAVRIYDRALTDEEVLNNYKIDNFRY